MALGYCAEILLKVMGMLLLEILLRTMSEILQKVLKMGTLQSKILMNGYSTVEDSDEGDKNATIEDSIEDNV